MLTGLLKGQKANKPFKSTVPTIVKDANYYKKVEEKAYELYEKRGCAQGGDWDDWFQAEKIIESGLVSSGAGSKSKRSAKRI